MGALFGEQAQAGAGDGLEDARPGAQDLVVDLTGVIERAERDALAGEAEPCLASRRRREPGTASRMRAQARRTWSLILQVLLSEPNVMP